MLDLLASFVIACLAAVIVGFFSVKFFIYGGLTTVVLWVIYTLLPGFTGATVSNMMWPRLFAIWTIWPRLMNQMLTQGSAEFGTLGVIIYGIVTVGMFIPYVSGVVSGLLLWPELIIVRLVF